MIASNDDHHLSSREEHRRHLWTIDLKKNSLSIEMLPNDSFFMTKRKTGKDEREQKREEKLIFILSSHVCLCVFTRNIQWCRKKFNKNKKTEEKRTK